MTADEPVVAKQGEPVVDARGVLTTGRTTTFDPEQSWVKGCRAKASGSSPDGERRRRMPEANLSTQSLAEFLERVSRDRPSPAAGSAAAVTAALGAALVGKAARLSGRHMDDAEQLAAEADDLRARALRLAEEDARAVANMSARVRPASEEAKVPADSTAGDTVDDAIAVPREIGEVAGTIAALARKLDAHGNPRLRADAVAAHRLADAAQQSADAIVRSNEGLQD